MNIFGKDKSEEVTETVTHEVTPEPTPEPDTNMDMETLFTLHTAIECIRYGKKSAGFLTELPLATAEEVAKYAYSVIMRFEDNYSESYQDDQGVYQTRGKGSMSLVTPLYIRKLKPQ